MPASPTDPCQFTASELLAAYASGQLSPVEVAQAVLARIERLNPLLNALVLVAPEHALASARESERAWQQGPRCAVAIPWSLNSPGISTRR